MAETSSHTIDGHDVVISGGAIFIDGVQATLNRTDVDVVQVIGGFFAHIAEESAHTHTAELPSRRDLRTNDEAVLPELSVVEARPGATIVINIGG